jgi:hypothetical protein
MMKLFILGWLVVGVTVGGLLFSFYREIISIEDGSDWFYE